MLVEFFEEFKPLLLDLLLALQEKILINSKELYSDNFEVLFEGLLLDFKFLLLLSHELGKLVESSLLDLGQDGAGNGLELVHDLGVASLEIIDFLEVLQAISSALVDKGISLSSPVELPNTGLNEPIQLRKMVIKQIFLLLVDNLHDAVVISYNKHHVLAQGAELFLLGQKSAQRLREGDQTV